MASQRATRMIMEALHYSRAASMVQNSLGGLGSILMLHRVGSPKKLEFSPNNHLNVTPEFLDELLGDLKGDFDFVDLDEAARRIINPNPKQPRFVTITLDDGYRDNLENAVPIFRKYDAPYTIYVAPGLADGRATLWWEDLERVIDGTKTIQLDMGEGGLDIATASAQQKSAAFDKILQYLTTVVSEEEQRRIMLQLCDQYGVDAEAHRASSIMSWQQLRELANDPLCTLGAHTVHHYAVARLLAEEARFEMEESRRLIEAEVGTRPQHFAYPYGFPAAAAQRDFAIALDLGFTSAVTTRHGVCYPDHGALMTGLPRVSLNGNFQKVRYVRTMLSGATTRLANKGRRVNA